MCRLDTLKTRKKECGEDFEIEEDTERKKGVKIRDMVEKMTIRRMKKRRKFLPDDLKD
jgi:hypothetical protein